MTPVVGLFNTVGGMGRTTALYHLAWTYADLGYRVLVADFDPQSTLTRSFVDDTFFRTISSPQRTGEVVPIAARIALMPSDPRLSLLEELLARAWLASDLDSQDEAQMFSRAVDRALEADAFDLALVDMAPAVSALNHSTVAACTHIVTAFSAGLVPAMDMEVVGTALRRWGRSATGHIAQHQPAGVGESARFHAMMLDVIRPDAFAEPRLGTLPWYASLMPMALEARKPIFHLKPADGALGAHAKGVVEARKDFKALAERIAAAIGLPSRDAPR